MLRFMIKLPFRIIAAPVWLVLAAVNIVLVFLVAYGASQRPVLRSKTAEMRS